MAFVSSPSATSSGVLPFLSSACADGHTSQQCAAGHSMRDAACRTFSAAPCSASMRTTSTWPRSDAACSGVRSIWRGRVSLCWLGRRAAAATCTHQVQRADVRLVLQQHDADGQAAALARLVQRRAAVLVRRSDVSPVRQQHLRNLQVPLLRRRVQRGAPVLRGATESVRSLVIWTAAAALYTDLALGARVGARRQQQLDHLQVALVGSGVQRSPILL